MKVKPLSDLHFEFYKDSAAVIQMINEVWDPEPVADILLLCGDIIPTPHLNKYKEALLYLCKRYRDVLFVHGNHEFYSSSPNDTFEKWEEVTDEFPNFWILNNNISKFFSLETKRFLGGTGWFPDDADAICYRRGMTDFQVINNFIPWVWEENQRFYLFLKENLQKDDILMMHHLPLVECIAPQWKNSQLNRFFVCSNIRDIILERKPKMVFYGHTHEAVNFKFEGIRFVNNAYAYPHESHKTFNRYLTLEI